MLSSWNSTIGRDMGIANSNSGRAAAPLATVSAVFKVGIDGIVKGFSAVHCEL
ncbi:MAG: hypothetical protein HRT36_06525 [Alphaproteobacteria bacterium]|nr:hypothetical protein [Alphaproteobacteria bacterium]